MKAENDVVSYLAKYGNTRESDIINYGVKKFDCSSKEMKKIINRLVVKGKLHRIVHNKLEPPEVYLSVKEPFHSDILKALIEVDMSEAVKKDTQKILEEAAAIAEKRIKEMESEEP
jgi:predicted transcriptional regulator